VVAALISVLSASAQPPTLADVMRRAHLYVVMYEDDQLSSVVATEHYRQRWQDHAGQLKEARTLISDFLIFQLPPEEDYFALRDVHEVDDRPVTDRTDIMERLRSDSAANMNERAMEIARESARFNVGRVYRTINLPLQALDLLHPQYRSLFDFRAVGRERVGGREAAVVAFQERSAPTLVSDGFGGELLARGRVWIEPTSGAVLRTELSFNGSAARYLKESAIRVDYQRDSKLQLLLPSEMEETYGLEIEVLHGVATYRNYRRFETAARLVTPPE
jgi:hypothetical protein